MERSDVRTRLLLYSEGWGTGGIESYIMNIIRHIDRSRIHFDIYCTHDYDGGYDKEIEALGAHRYCLYRGRKPGLPRRIICSPIALYKMVKRNKYNVVHINTMNGTGFIYGLSASLAGASTVIIHSHSTNFGKSNRYIKEIVHTFCCKFLCRHSYVKIACSESAGKFIFGNHSFIAMPNGIDCAQYQFDKTRRDQIRTELDIADDALVVGSVMRLSKEKNPLFLLSCFSQLVQYSSNSFLLLIGDGELAEAVTDYISKSDFTDRVRWVRKTSDVSAYLSAMDVFLTPSLYEGLPMSMVEAQASGLQIICSSGVSGDAKITDLVTYLPLELGESTWAKTILALNLHYKRDGYSSLVTLKGFDVRATAGKLQKVYLQ